MDQPFASWGGNVNSLDKPDRSVGNVEPLILPGVDDELPPQLERRKKSNVAQVKERGARLNTFVVLVNDVYPRSHGLYACLPADG